MIFFLFLLVCLWASFRYIFYVGSIGWNTPSTVPIVDKYDQMYEEALKGPRGLLSDYNTKNIESFKQGYSTCLLRKYLWSNATDVYLELGEVKDGHHLLDAGCGTGVQAIHFCKKLPLLTISCIVNSEKCYKTTLKNVEKAKLTDRIKVYFMDFDHLAEPILSQRFDRIFMIQTVGYSVDRRNLFKNLYPLLKPEGKLFISTATIRGEVKDEQANNIIQIWKYNFSTIGSILTDLKEYKTKYIELDHKIGTYLCINPMDLYYIWEFNALNGWNTLNTSFYFTSPLTNHFILVSS
jgi:precorrin-6B methylase 2